MTILAIDTAGAYCSAALGYDDGGERHRLSAFEPMGRGQAERILPMVEELLQRAGLDYGALDEIRCSVGPGSFTGVRIGIALAKGLALASGRPLYGVGRLLVIGQKYAAMDGAVAGPIAVVIDAGRGEIYVQAFAKLHGAVEGLTAPSLVSLEEAAGFFSAHQVDTVIGPALDPAVLQRLGAIGRSFAVVDGQAEDLLHIGAHLFDHGDAVRPLYLRAADAKPQVGKALKRQKI